MGCLENFQAKVAYRSKVASLIGCLGCWRKQEGFPQVASLMGCLTIEYLLAYVASLMGCLKEFKDLEKGFQPHGLLRVNYKYLICFQSYGLLRVVGCLKSDVPLTVTISPVGCLKQDKGILVRKSSLVGCLKKNQTIDQPCGLPKF